MKKIKLLIYSPLLLLILLFPIIMPGSEPETDVAPETTDIVSEDTLQTVTTASLDKPASAAVKRKAPVADSRTTPARKSLGNATRQEIVAYALSLLGKPYTYGGVTPSGFDCSGFTTHVFNSFGVDVSRSSSTQAHDGDQVAKEEAKPGDLVIFTGTNPDIRTPGHVGIVISSPGDTISFVHSSSNGGVKISTIEGTRYDTRFLQIRRVL